MVSFFPANAIADFFGGGWHWSLNVILIGVLPALICIAIILTQTLFSHWDLVQLIVGVILLYGLLQARYFFRHALGGLRKYLAYIVLGISPNVLAVYLLLNYFIPVSINEAEVPVTHITRNDNSWILRIEINEKEKTLTIDNKYYGTSSPKAVILKYATGLFGHEVVEDLTLVR